MELSQWDYKIQYRQGSENTVADALSRQPLPACEVTTAKYDWYKRTLQEVGKNPTSRPEFCIRDGQLYRHVLHSLDTYYPDDGKDETLLAVENLLKEMGEGSESEYDPGASTSSAPTDVPTPMQVRRER